MNISKGFRDAAFGFGAIAAATLGNGAQAATLEQFTDYIAPKVTALTAENQASLMGSLRREAKENPVQFEKMADFIMQKEKDNALTIEFKNAGNSRTQDGQILPNANAGHVYSTLMGGLSANNTYSLQVGPNADSAPNPLEKISSSYATMEGRSLKDCMGKNMFTKAPNCTAQETNVYQARVTAANFAMGK